MQNEKVPAAMQDNVTEEDKDCCLAVHVALYEGRKRGAATDGIEEARKIVAAHRIASTTAQTEAVQALVDALGESREALFQFKAHNAWRMTAGENDVVSNAISNADRALAAHRESQP